MAIYQFSMIPLEEETHFITYHKDRMVAPPCSQIHYARALYIMRNFNDVFKKLRSGKYLFTQANRDYVEKHRMRHRSIQIYEVHQEVPISVQDCEHQLEELYGRLLEIGDIDFMMGVINFVAPGEEDYLGRYWIFQRVDDDEDEDSTDVEEDENDEVVEESKVETLEEEKEEVAEDQNVEVANSPTIPNDDFDEDEPEMCNRCGGRFYEYLHDYTCEVHSGANSSYFVCGSCESEMTSCGVCDGLPRWIVMEESKVETLEEEKEEVQESVAEALQNVSNTIFEKKEVFTDGEFKGMMESLQVIFKNPAAAGSERPEVLTYRNSRFSSGHNIIVGLGDEGRTTIYTNCPDPWDMDTEQFDDWSEISRLVFRDYAEAVADGEIDGQEEDEEPEIADDETEEDEDSDDERVCANCDNSFTETSDTCLYRDGEIAVCNACEDFVFFCEGCGRVKHNDECAGANYDLTGDWKSCDRCYDGNDEENEEPEIADDETKEN